MIFLLLLLLNLNTQALDDQCNELTLKTISQQVHCELKKFNSLSNELLKKFNKKDFAAYEKSRKKINQFEFPEELLQGLEKVCLNDNPAVCPIVASRYWNKDDKKFLVLGKHGCTNKISQSCINLAAYYKEKEINLRSAIQYYKKACELNNVMGCIHLGEAYYTFKEPLRDKPKALEYFKIACNKFKSSQACYNAACFYSLEKDTKNAFDYLEVSLELGFNLWQHIANDKDLDFIKTDPRFKKLINKAQNPTNPL